MVFAPAPAARRDLAAAQRGAGDLENSAAEVRADADTADADPASSGPVEGGKARSEVARAAILKPDRPASAAVRVFRKGDRLPVDAHLVPGVGAVAGPASSVSGEVRAEGVPVDLVEVADAGVGDRQFSHP